MRRRPDLESNLFSRSQRQFRPAQRDQRIERPARLAVRIQVQFLILLRESDLTCAKTQSAVLHEKNRDAGLSARTGVSIAPLVRAYYGWPSLRKPNI